MRVQSRDKLLFIPLLKSRITATYSVEGYLWRVTDEEHKHLLEGREVCDKILVNGFNKKSTD